MAYETAIMVGGVGVLWYFAMLMINLDEEHNILRLFYLLVSVWFAVGLVNLANTFALDNGASAAVTGTLDALWLVTLVISIVVSGYFVIYYMWRVFNWLNKLLTNKNNGGDDAEI